MWGDLFMTVKDGETMRIKYRKRRDMFCLGTQMWMEDCKGDDGGDE